MYLIENIKIFTISFLAWAVPTMERFLCWQFFLQGTKGRVSVPKNFSLGLYLYNLKSIIMSASFWTESCTSALDRTNWTLIGKLSWCTWLSTLLPFWCSSVYSKTIYQNTVKGLKIIKFMLSKLSVKAFNVRIVHQQQTLYHPPQNT